MATPAKQAVIAELTERFQESGAAVLTEYRGLSVKQLSGLRDSLRANGTFAVVKNTLTQRAAQEAGVSAFDGQFSGPSAIAFITGDPVEAAKSLRDFAKANPLLVIKAGVLDGRALSAEDITKLADLESREVLLSKLAGAMNASLSQAVSLFAAPLSQTARLVEAWRAKVEEQGGAGAPAAGSSEPAPADSTDATTEPAATEAPEAAAEPAPAEAGSTTTPETPDAAAGGDAG